MFDRRSLLASMAAAPFFAPAMLRGQDLSRIALAPIDVKDGRVWMPVRFGSGEMQRFVLDTGAFMNLMREDLAKRLELRKVGSTRIGGLGGVGRHDAYRAPDVSIGEVRVGQIVFAAYRPSELLIHPLAQGLLSSGLVTVADTDLDFDAGLWRLHLDGRADRSGFEPLPSKIDSKGPDSGAAKIVVDAVIDGESYRLAVDTGSPGEILLGPAGTRQSKLWNDTTPFAPHRVRGLGGDGGAARLVRASRASLGGIAFERPLVSLTDPREGRRMEHDGLLGIGLIERMNLSTEVKAGRLWARRNARPARPERYGMSGLWLGEKGGGVVIEEVGTGSPAAEAGLRRGDAVDGGTLQEWIRRVNGRPGNTIEMPWRRGEESGTARLVLRAYL